MKLVEKALLYKPRSAATPVTWASYLTSLALPAWWRMRDTSGVTVVNSGSIGSALDLTATAWTMNQAGQLGPGEAGLADGANTRLQAANNATLAGYTTWEWAFLVNPTSAGESNTGTYMTWGNNVNEPIVRHTVSLANLRVLLYNTTPSTFTTVTSSGLTANIWQILFVAYDDAGDRKVHVRVGVTGAVSEATYTSQLAMTGTYLVPTSAFNLFNTSNQAQTYAGLADEVFAIGGRTFTPAERLQMTLLAGV